MRGRPWPVVAKVMLACSLVIGVTLGPLRADAAGPQDRVAAEQAYREGTRLYELGEYSEALAAFKRAYLAYDAPAFLYNIGRCHERLGERELAIDRYGAFLSRDPDSSDRASVEERIRTLRAEVDAAHATAALALRKRKPVYKRWWLWTVVGAVAVGAGLGVGLGLGLHPGPPNAHFSGVVAF